MNTHANKTKENKSQSVANILSQKQSNNDSTFQLVDKRPEAIAQKKQQDRVNGSPLLAKATQLQALADSFSEKTVQKAGIEEEEAVQGKFETVQKQGAEEEEELMQGKFKTIQKQGAEEEELMQGKFKTIQKQGAEEEELMQGKFKTIQKQEAEEEELQMKKTAIQKKASTKPGQSKNSTGLPDNLKTGMETLSGYSMDDVKVHRNSDKPAQLQAHAYAQGTDIHVAPGQEQHLPHEAWHVVQQKQGRVRPTKQMKNKPSTQLKETVNVNDDAGLEKEADIMGQKAESFNSTTENKSGNKNQSLNNSNAPIQGWWPKGHRLITELAFDKGNFQDKFDKEAKQYLIKRSPDIDFFQDNFETMSEGQKQTKPYFQIYKSYIEAGELEKAKAMYENGELNKRRGGFLLMHGEGGAYKEKNAASKNEAVTNMFVEKAIGEWNSDNKKKGLSTLSDALHQSADRGSHGEGNAFTGHDTRIGLGVKGEGEIPGIGKQTWEKQAWELPLGGKLGGTDWQPDNFSVNTKGATLGVAFVIGALGKFINKTNGKISMQGEGEEKRRKLFGFATSDSLASKTQGKTGGGIDDLKKVVDENSMGLLPELVKGMQDPVNKNPEEFQSTLEKGKQFYEGELSAGKIYDSALIEFRKVNKSKNKKNIKEGFAKQYYNTELGKAERNGQDKILVAKHIKRAYKKVYGSELDVVTPQEEKTITDDRVKIFNDASEKFTNWSKSRLKGGYKKSKRISEAKKYYYGEVLKQKNKEDRDFYGATIKAAYVSVFGEQLIA
ncbi:MAG: DUF4157 domain-containing protein [Saprospiraceae bacterium]|nr:DUF4157 domain-containing protein [Saprospiraceae bacterium]